MGDVQGRSEESCCFTWVSRMASSKSWGKCTVLACHRSVYYCAAEVEISWGKSKVVTHHNPSPIHTVWNTYPLIWICYCMFLQILCIPILLDSQTERSRGWTQSSKPSKIAAVFVGATSVGRTEPLKMPSPAMATLRSNGRANKHGPWVNANQMYCIWLEQNMYATILLYPIDRILLMGFTTFSYAPWITLNIYTRKRWPKWPIQDLIAYLLNLTRETMIKKRATLTTPYSGFKASVLIWRWREF